MSDRVIGVTGGHGVLGRAVVEAALGDGLKVAVIDHARGLSAPEGVLYAGVPVMALVVIRRQPGGDGLLWALWTLALVWATDIGAYFAGRAIGGPKLWPAVSPNKTWAGLIGGMAAASVFAAVLHTLAGLPLRLALATPFLAVLAQGGDLYESLLKRRAGAKDSGALLPGHGGVMDRLDGVVPVAPVAALLVAIPASSGCAGAARGWPANGGAAGH